MSNPTTLPPIVQKIAAECPQAGGGVHIWLFCFARQLHCHFPDKEAMADFIAQCVKNCGRDVPRREIMDAIRRSESVAWRPNGTQPTASRYKPLPPQKAWPDLNTALVSQILAGNFGLNDLGNLSPVKFLPHSNNTEAVIGALFPGNPLLCVGWSSDNFVTRPRESLRGKLDGMQLIVPSPMSKPLGKVKDSDRESAHTLDNTGPRRFLVLEFDTGGFDDHAAKLHHLAKNFAPLVLAVHSGNKSLHGWFYCKGQPEEALKKFMRYAVAIGADKATWTRSQFVRMPGGLRNDGGKRRKQFIQYFNPAIVEAAR